MMYSGLLESETWCMELDAGHLLAPLGHLDAVTHKDEAIVDSHGRGKQAKDHPRPQ